MPYEELCLEAIQFLVELLYPVLQHKQSYLTSQSIIFSPGKVCAVQNEDGGLWNLRATEFKAVWNYQQTN